MILCLFCFIFCTHYPALAGEIRTVELKMWEDYTKEEKKFLQERWELGRIDSVVVVLKDWDKISPDRYWVESSWWITRQRNLFSPYVNGRDNLIPWDKRPSYAPESDKVCSLFTVLAENFTIVPVKEWKEYTDAEKKVLRARWTSEKILAVVSALAGKKWMPDFVAKLDSGSKTSFDLRGVQIRDLFVGGLDRDSIYLQGANLRSMTWQGTKIRWARLQGADLREARFKNAHLVAAEMQGADLRWAELESCDVRYAKLQDAYLFKAELQSANLKGAQLQGADLTEAQLQGVDLPSANLQGANLQRVNLQDVNLYGARFDSTHLWQVNLGAAKNIRYIIWGDSLKSRHFIGEEITADSTKTYEDFRKAEITYRILKTLYKSELMDDVATEFHFRENEVRTKASSWYVRPFRLLFLKWTYGYSSRPMWLLWYSLIVIGGFALIYSILTIPRKTKSGIYLVKAGDTEKEELLPFNKGRLFLDCLYFSTLSFATFGYGAIKPKQWLQLFRLEPVEYKPVRWARIFVGIEAALGIWIFALLVTVLFGK